MCCPVLLDSISMFLTLEDPNAKIKGSRDPLGAQPMWAEFGRHVVVNLTMQTNSLRGFTILLLARYLTERVIEEGRLGRESALDAFLRFEQVGAYVRHVAHDVESDIRGIERVRSNVANQNGKVSIAANPGGFILIDQKVNGLWGLFSVSARVSGLILDGPVGLTSKAREFVEHAYLPSLRGTLDALLHMVEKDGRLDTVAPDAVFAALSEVLSQSFTSEEREFYGAYLRDGLHVRQDSDTLRYRQKTFSELLAANIDPDSAIERKDMVLLSNAAQSVDNELAHRLDRIVRLEAVLAPAMSLFDFLLTCHGREIGDIEEELMDRWGKSVPYIDAQKNSDLLVEIGATSSSTVKKCFDRCQRGLGSGSYDKALDALLAWHEDTMRRRGGAPWVRVAEDGRLDVGYRGTGQVLPDGDELSALWRNGYFIPPLRAIIGQLGRAA